MRRLWHRYVLRHQMVGPHAVDQHTREWHDLACGESFQSLVFSPRLEEPPL